MKLSELTAPLTPDMIDWRVQSQTKDSQKIIVVPYLTNRVVMERFDNAFGPMGWQSSFVEVADGFLCTLSVKNGDEWISKTDGATRTSIEPLKGGISGAMKRCAVQFGVGRGLYDFPTVFIETNEKYIPQWANKWLDNLVEKINSGEVVRDFITLKDKTFPAQSKQPVRPDATTEAVPQKPIVRNAVIENFQKEISEIQTFPDFDRVEIAIYGTKMELDSKRYLFKICMLGRIRLITDPDSANVVARRLQALKTELGVDNFNAIVPDLVDACFNLGMVSEKGKGFKYATDGK